MNIICNIDYKKFQSKPTSSDIAKISNRIIKKNEDYKEQLKDVMIALGNGQTILPFRYHKDKRAKANFKETNLILLDFDNKDLVLSLEECLEMSFTKEQASFYYETFSSTEELNKYRIGFVLSEPIKNLENFYKAYKYLLEIYPQADRACNDCSRIFYGGKNANEINLGNILELNYSEIEITNTEIPYPIRLEADTTIINRKVNQELIRNYKLHNLDEIKEYLKITGVTLPNTSYVTDKVMLKDFNKLNMYELYGLPKKTFNCILYTDTSPSCSILKLKNGDYIYKRFSESKELNLNNFQLLNNLLGDNYNLAIRSIMELFEIEITIRTEKDILVEKLLKPLFIEEQQKEYGNYYKLLRSSKYIVEDLLESIFDTPRTTEKLFLNSNRTSMQFISMYSTRAIAEKILANSITSLDTKRKRINNILATLTYLGILESISDEKLNKHFKINLTTTLKENKKTYRMNIYRLNLNSELKDIEERAKHLTDNKITVTKMTAEYLVLLDGVEETKNTLVQSKKEKVTDIQLAILNDISEKITEAFEGDSVYIIEKELKDFLNSKYNNSYIQKNYNVLFSKLEETLDYSRIFLTNELKTQLNITSTSRKMKVIIKNSYYQ